MSRAPHTAGSYCMICGRRGHNQRTCPDKEKVAQATAMLTEERYTMVQLCKGLGQNSSDTAEVHALPLREVNAAWCSPTYEMYLKERRRGS